nr:MAG TPA: Dolichol-phosphate mannosyltransferase subunit [Caudoviricetes sp.]
MAKVWKNRIEAGAQKFSDCPERYKEDVLQLLREDVDKNVISEDRFYVLTGFVY